VDTFLQIFQLLFEPNDFTKPIIILLILMGVFLFGLFTYLNRKRKLKIIEKEMNIQLSKQLKNSQDLTELLVVLTLLNNGKK
jgi:formate hydrogenlyase subunit 3/multisubunit Na+/H+ antiporter MnhD subunit